MAIIAHYTLALAIALFALTEPTLASGQRIDLDKYILTFEEEFYTLDVSSRGPDTRWIAQTPWGGNFGKAAFAAPKPGFPFSIEDGVLRIEARKDNNGKWRSGLLASVDLSGKGFSQQYGYFEIRAKLPIGEGLWPAFWLIGLDRETHTAEIDVLEHYGHAPDRYKSAVHVWNRSDRGKSRSVYHQNPVLAGSLYDQFNTYGVDVGPKWIRFFFNRAEVWRTRTPPHHRQPMYVLLNLGLGGGPPINNAPSPAYMFIDYVRAYQARD
ncbi:glycoside hydrolase family 16 protein [Microvirga sp. 3-52]|nr:glycoside hydrolase family 16 protein [Microvirga sp. 3-52]